MAKGLTKDDRRLRNLYLDPSVQLKVSFHFMSLILISMGFLMLLIFSNLSSFVQMLPSYSGTPEELIRALHSYITYTMWLAVGLLFIMAIFSFVLSLIVTHRLVGPMVPIKRHVRALINGQFDHRVSLRKTDEFQDVAEELNELASTLAKRMGGK